MSIEPVMPSSHLILCHPLLLLPPIPPSIRVFSNESTLHMRWPAYWSFSCSFSPSNEHPGLISFRTDWVDLLAVQGTPKSLLQHHSSKASIIQCPAFFMVQLSHPYMLLLLLSCFSHVRLCATPYTAAHQAPLSMGFSRQENGSGVPLPSPHPYLTTGKNIALTRWTCVGKVMFLLFNMLSRLVITFLPRSKHLNFMAAITICSDVGTPQNKD